MLGIPRFLGGQSFERRYEIYLRIDPTEKLDTLDAVALPSLKRGKSGPLMR